jgi:hypothetical protein
MNLLHGDSGRLPRYGEVGPGGAESKNDQVRKNSSSPDAACMAVSRFGRFPIQMNFAENRNAAASPKMAAQPARAVGGPTGGLAGAQGALQGTRRRRRGIACAVAGNGTYPVPRKKENDQVQPGAYPTAGLGTYPVPRKEKQPTL